jgi:hypothetical protein
MPATSEPKDRKEYIEHLGGSRQEDVQKLHELITVTVPELEPHM